MKRKIFITSLILALILSVSMVSFAAPPIVVPGGIVKIDPIPDLTLTQEELDAGYTVNVTGFTEFNVPTGNQGRLDILTLEVQKDSGAWETIQEFNYEPPLNSIDLVSRGLVTGREFGFTAPWIISSVGSYLVRVTADFTGSSNDYGTVDGSEAVTVTLITPVVVDYPAAPAVAAKILKDAGISHKYDTGEVDAKFRPIYGNYISAVAQKMGSDVLDENGSWFNGIDKRDIEAYRNAIYDYLIELGANLPK